MKNKIIVSAAGGLSGVLSDEDERTYQLKLWQLLKRQTEMYTMGDSSSVRVEIAQALLESIQFCLDLYLKKTGNSRTFLVTADLNEIFALGIKEVEEEVDLGRKLYHAVCLSSPGIENISFRDTIKSIGKFFKRYDYRYFAQTISCDIDYQLCHAVEDSFLGIEYINEYLRRVIIENDFIRRFDHDKAVSLLEKYCPDYRGLLINLYEPVAENAVGLALIKENVGGLCVSKKDLQRLSELFGKLSMTPAKHALREAAGRVCAELGIKDRASKSYLQKTAEGLYPRIEAALPSGSLGGIFLSF